MNKFDYFSLLTGILGLIVDSITLLGVILGLDIPLSIFRWDLFSNPLIISIVTSSILCYTIFIFSYFLLRFVKRSRKQEGIRFIVFNTSQVVPLTFIIAFLFLPFYVIWGIAVSNLYNFEQAFTAFLCCACIFVYIIAVEILLLLALFLEWLLHSDTEFPIAD